MILLKWDILRKGKTYTIHELIGSKEGVPKLYFEIKFQQDLLSLLNSNIQQCTIREAIEPLSNDVYSNLLDADTVPFDYASNYGIDTIGEDPWLFKLEFGAAGDDSIHILNDPETIKTIALAVGVDVINAIVDAKVFDTTSRSGTAYKNGIIVPENSLGCFACVKVLKVKSRYANAGEDAVRFKYVIHFFYIVNSKNLFCEDR